jgi:hypothetical protein
MVKFSDALRNPQREYGNHKANGHVNANAESGVAEHPSMPVPMQRSRRRDPLLSHHCAVMAVYL